MLKAFNLKNLFKNQFSLALNLKKINKMDSKNVMTDTSTANLNENKTKIDNEIEDVANKKIKLDNSEQAAVENNEPNNESKRPGIKKRKYALLVGYCGEGYFGLQRNSSIKNNQFRTIEDELVDGLVKLNAIPQQHADEMFKVYLNILEIKFSFFFKDFLYTFLRCHFNEQRELTRVLVLLKI